MSRWVIVGAAAFALTTACSFYTDDGDGRPVPDDIVGVEGFIDQGTVDVAFADSFAAIPLNTDDARDRIFLAWNGEDGSLEMGILSLGDGTFRPMPSYPRGQLSDVSVAVGGSESDRVFITWVESNPWRLMLLVVDTEGNVVAPAAAVAEAVNVAPPRVAGTAGGAIIVYSWGDDEAAPNDWDPWIVRVDTDGAVIAMERVARTARQTFGVDVASAHDGTFAITYADSGDQRFFVRRYDADGLPIEQPVEVGLTTAGYQPWSAIVETDGSLTHTLVLGLPDRTELTYNDVRFARAAAKSADGLAMTTTFGESVDGFEPPVRDIDASVWAGSPSVTAVWERVLARDPEWMGCTIPPPVHTQLVVQRLAVGDLMPRIGEAIVVREWTADEGVPMPTGAKVITSHTNEGQFVILWSEGALRYRRFSL